MKPPAFVPGSGEGSSSRAVRRHAARVRGGVLLLATMAVAIVALSSPSAASAFGPISYFQFQLPFQAEKCPTISCPANAPGVFGNSTASAVNSSGGGGAQPGDVYVAGDGRIQQFSAKQKFIRLWGADVVKSGPDNSSEVQAVRVDATSGSFRLSFGANTTADIPATAPAAQLESALEGLGTIGSGGVSVSGGAGGAGGSSPYMVTFTGALAGIDQPLLKATSGSPALSGGAASVTTYTTVRGNTGFEVCSTEAGDECQHRSESTAALGGETFFIQDIAVDQSTGDLYARSGQRVEEYRADGQFLRAFGKDVVQAGPDDSSAPDEEQELAVKASGGTFTLGFSVGGSQNPPTTAPIPYDASAATVQSALNALNGIAGVYGSVTVSGGPGDATGSSPYLVSFHGTLGGDDLAPIKATGAGLTGDERSATVTTVKDGGAYEVCLPRDQCKEGSRGSENGSFGDNPEGLTVAPPAAPNAGNLVTGDKENFRVQEFTPAGAFVRAFGWDVDATEPSTGFEVCPASDTCQAGTPGEGVGQFSRRNDGESTLHAVAEDSSGAIYTVEEVRGFSGAFAGGRVQKFTPSGGEDLTPSLFGKAETQSLTVNASAGQFRLSLGLDRDSVAATADLTAGSSILTNVQTSKGHFIVGQTVRASTDLIESGAVFNRIVALGPDTITLNQPVLGSAVDLQIRSDTPYTTPDLPYNATASAVESALNALPSMLESGGPVSVSGGPGEYSITFDAGPKQRVDAPDIGVVQGTTPLSGGSGPGANTARVETSVPGGPSGTLKSSGPFDIAVGSNDRVFVLKYFPLGFTTCQGPLVTPPEIRIEELAPDGEAIRTSEPCNGFPGFEEGNNLRASLTANLATGNPYLLFITRLDVFGDQGNVPDLSLDPISAITATGGSVSGTIDANGPGTEYPDVSGTPSSYRTTYRIDYKKASESDWTKYTPDIPLGSGSDPVPFSLGIGGLAPKTPYEIRVVAAKPFAGAVEEVKSFTTGPAPPLIESVSSSDVSASSAELHAKINPQGTATTYRFEYGTTPAYGQSTTDADAGESLQGQLVNAQIEGLQDAVYHFRVVATNALGTTRSEDQTFNFHPSVCPNQTVRQQTGAAYLPDCRAYELVSPEDAGGTTLFTGGPQSPYASNPPRLAFVGQLAAIPNSGRNPINTAGDLYIATRGAEGWHTRYIGPSAEEAGCVGGRPIVSGTGGTTTIQNDVMADPSLSRIIDWNLGNPAECYSGSLGNLRFEDFNTAALGSNAPYLWNAHGDFLDRWPTSTADVTGSEANFACPQDPSVHPYPPRVFGNIPVPYFCSTYVDASKDLSHFVFATQSGLFGEGGLTVAPGSAYDNDTAHNTLKLVSKLPGGGAIGQEPGGKAGPEELIQFPAVSADGSHILMGTATKPACKQVDYPAGDEENGLCPIITQPTHLYMRVDNAFTYDVSAGKPVHYIGSTPDGAKVYFTSDERLTADDTDESTDLYMWSEGSPQLTRISKGAPDPAGDSDNCVSTWTEDCDVKTYSDSKITSAQGNQGGLGNWDITNPNPGYTDNAIAADTGDIYFYSPEQLVEGKGAPGKENLYVYRDGGVHEVAALEPEPYCIPEGDFENQRETCSDGAAGRLQVTPDGKFAAFVTTSRLTAYDNEGHAEMYRYDAEAETIQCVSCRTDNEPPEGDVLASQGGRFITDDGRVFFNTPEPLVPRDTNTGLDPNGQIAGADVYEFVDGRAQLISTGTGTDVRGRGSSSLPGLYGVSADGVDVYFGTYGTLVGQDRNGAQLKFYDARTNGGFSFVPPPAPCAAADECHGPTAPTPAPLAGGTASALGTNGNLRPAKPHKRKHRKAHKAKSAKGKRVKANGRKGGVR